MRHRVLATTRLFLLSLTCMAMTGCGGLIPTGGPRENPYFDTEVTDAAASTESTIQSNDAPEAVETADEQTEQPQA